MQLLLEMREYELNTKHDAQSKEATDFKPMCTRTVNRSFDSVEVHSAT